MKKILFALLFALPFLFAGCGEETTTTTSGDISNPVTETATLEQTVLYSVLKTDKNTTASVKISGVSETAGDTISVSFPESSPAENFTVSQGYAFDNVYGIALYRNSKETSVDKFNVSVKNRLGTEILNKDGYIYIQFIKYSHTILIHKLVIFLFLILIITYIHLIRQISLRLFYLGR